MKHLPIKNRDLRREVYRRDVLRVIGCLLWLAAWIGGALAYNAKHSSYPPSLRFVGWRLVLLILAATISGILIFRVWRLITGRTVCGVIESSSLSRSYSASADPGESTDYDFRLNTKLRIRLENGKTKTLSFEQKNGFYHYYYEGARIVRLRGLPYPLRLDGAPSVGYVCAVCGTWSETKVDACPRCGRSMIDPNELDMHSS